MKIDIRNISGGYYGQDIIKDISLTIDSADMVGIIGPNGSGKTTLLRFLSRALPVRTGAILYNGRESALIPLKDFARSVAFVGQDIAISFPFTVLEIVLMGRIPHLGRLEHETGHDRSVAEEALRLTDTMHLKDKRIDELSAGERQRVLIAKALAQEPDLLFLDEPTSHLDIAHQIQVFDLLRRLNRTKKLTIVMVIHDLNLASEYCGRVVLFDQGGIYKEGLPEGVLTYQNIEAVYKTVVVVKENSMNKKPYVILVPGEK